jgi:hypothetical protein
VDLDVVSFSSHGSLPEQLMSSDVLFFPGAWHLGEIIHDYRFWLRAAPDVLAPHRPAGRRR